MNRKVVTSHSSRRAFLERNISPNGSLLFKRGTLQVCRLVYIENGDIYWRKFEITDVIVFLRKDSNNLWFNMRRVCAQQFQGSSIGRVAFFKDQFRDLRTVRGLQRTVCQHQPLQCQPQVLEGILWRNQLIRLGTSIFSTNDSPVLYTSVC